MTVGVGQDSFVFDQTTPGAIGQAAITGFNPNKDSFTFSNQLTTSVSYQDDAHGNAVITVDSGGRHDHARGCPLLGATSEPTFISQIRQKWRRSFISFFCRT